MFQEVKGLEEIVLEGKIEFKDNDNLEWGIQNEDEFVVFESLLAEINDYLTRKNIPSTKIGDKIKITIERK